MAQQRSEMVRGRLALLLPHLSGGGAERIAVRLAQDFLAAGYHVDLILQQTQGELLSLLPSEVKIVDLKAERIRDVVAPLKRYLQESRPDAMQISMWPLTVAGLIAHRLARSKARVVISDHTVLSKQYEGRAVLRALKLTTRYFYPLADTRVTVSHGAAADLARLSGIAQSKIEVVYNPIAEPPPEVRISPEIESLWGAADGRILTAGTLKRAKNHHLLIRSFAILRRRRPAKLMILGEGELRVHLQALAAREGVADDVLLPGFASDPWPYYASANLFALSSRYEGFGNVLVEAMHCGLPVVSTDCESGPREILDNGKYGTLVPMDDEQALAEAMETALREPADPSPLKARARELSGQSSSDRYLQLMVGGSEAAGATSARAAAAPQHRG